MIFPWLVRLASMDSVV